MQNYSIAARWISDFTTDGIQMGETLKNMGHQEQKSLDNQGYIW